jgi:hypothetical protein
VAEERIENADRSSSLRPVAEVGIRRIAARPQVLDRDRMLAMNAHRERRFCARDVIVASPVGDYASHEVLAPRHIEGSFVTKNQAQRKEGLGRDAIMVVTFTGAVNGSDRGVARATEGRALKRDRISEP